MRINSKGLVLEGFLATVINKKLHYIEGQRAINPSPLRPDSSGIKDGIELWEVIGLSPIWTRKKKNKKTCTYNKKKKQ